jgi:DNA-binding transcriptional ArsR family regulator
MIDSRAELILHPIRMRIILAIGTEHLTAQQVAAQLPDVAQATLYRHINKLAKGGMLEIVSERPVRGAVERVYRLKFSRLTLSQEDLASATPEELMRYFTTFTAGLLGDFATYLNNHPQPKLDVDGVGFHTAPLYLSADELDALRDGLRALLLPLLKHRATPDRQRLHFSTILIPSGKE